MSIQEKREKAKEIVESLKGLQLSDAKEILGTYCRVALSNLEEKLQLQ